MGDSRSSPGSVEAMAEVIHMARWPADRQLAATPFADEDQNGREYCFRIARAVLAALPVPDAVRLEQTIDLLERNAGIQAKLLAETGRRLEFMEARHGKIQWDTSSLSSTNRGGPDAGNT